MALKETGAFCGTVLSWRRGSDIRILSPMQSRKRPALLLNYSARDAHATCSSPKLHPFYPEIIPNDLPELECLVADRTTMQDQIAYLIATVNRQLEEELQESLRPEGIPIEQFRILNALFESDGLSMGELASAVLVEAASLTKIVDRMVAEALVYRAAASNDRRRIRIFLATKGKALHRRLKGIVSVQQRNLIERLDATKAKELTRLLRGLMRE